MPIRPFLNGEQFDDDTVRVMGLAFEAVCIALRIGNSDDDVRQAIATKVIDLAPPRSDLLHFMCPGPPPWMWASGHSVATMKRGAHGYEPTREAAMAALAKSWRRSPGAPADKPSMWTLAYRYREDRTPTHGYEATREAAMVAFAKSWRRE